MTGVEKTHSKKKRAKKMLTRKSKWPHILNFHEIIAGDVTTSRQQPSTPKETVQNVNSSRHIHINIMRGGQIHKDINVGCVNNPSHSRPLGKSSSKSAQVLYSPSRYTVINFHSDSSYLQAYVVA